jgi:hypothetical protein
MLLLDGELHHLGDNQYSPISAAAGQFKKDAEGAVFTCTFSLKGLSLDSDTLTLDIGSIIGLDTTMAHALHQSLAPHESSPIVIKVNGQKLAYISKNGEHQRIPIPKQNLNANGLNLLEIEAGYHVPNGTRVDYDDLELMNLILQL